MKRIIAIYCSIIMVVLLTACAAQPAAETVTSAPEPTASVSQTAGEKTASAEQGEPTEEVKPSAAVIEPEALLSMEEASAIAGVSYTVSEKKEQAVVGQKLAVYKTADGSNYLQITLTQQAFMPQNAPSTPEKLYRDITAAFPDAKKIEGLGEEAVLFNPLLHVLHKGYYLTFASDCPDGKLIEAAKAAVAKLDTVK